MVCAPAGIETFGPTSVMRSPARPREAWTDPADPLNHRVPAVQITNEAPNGVLLGLSNLIFYNQFRLEPGGELRGPAAMGTPVSFPTRAGTIIDALNQLAEQTGLIMWVAYARPRDNPDGWNVCQTPGSCHSDLQFDLRNAQRISGTVATQLRAFTRRGRG